MNLLPHRRTVEATPGAHLPAPSVRRNAVSLVIVLLLGLGALWLFFPQQRRGAVAGDPVAAALALARVAGSYRFSGDMLQVTTPSSTVANVGRASQTDQLYLEGQISLDERQAEMRLWSQDGAVSQGQSGLGVRVEGGKTLIREGAGAWQERPGFTDGFAPDGDLMAYLVAARDVEAHAPETRAGITFTRLTFGLDGPTLATYLRDQLDRALRDREVVPAGMQADASHSYRDIAGSGELWVGQDGLPLRQILTLQFPEQGGERVSATINLTFSDYGRAAGASFLAGVAAALPDPSAGAALLLAVAGTWTLIRYRRSRRLGGALAVTLIVTLLAGPLLQSLRVRSFLDAQVAQAAVQEAERAEQAQARQLQQGLAAPPFNPHADPLATPVPPAEPAAELAISGPAAANVLLTDDGSDGDSDGLTNYQEERAGTSSTDADTDADGVTDGVELRGATLDGQRWFLNPNRIDSNDDGLSDGQEYDLNNDGIPDDTDGDCSSPDLAVVCLPDAFDSDNDNDGVPDAKDLSPFTRIDQAFSEATPFNLRVNNLASGKPTFVDFQLRPADQKRLWFAFNVLDWPFDASGQVRDTDGRTYADLARSQGRAPAGNESFGDMKLIPMLEIRLNANSANLPPQSDLSPYNITVNDFTANGATKVVYVPLNIITDEKSGQRIAFGGRMRYLPTGTWATPHQVRLAWVVQVLTDVPCDPTGANAAQQGCPSDGYIRNVPQMVQTYYDSWTLTGLNVKEDNGAGIAVAYEDPAVDPNLKEDGALTALAAGLDNAFIGGRDQDGNGQRDVDLAEIARRFDRLGNGAVSDDQRWAIPNTLRVERKEYATFDQALITTTMTETARILSAQFNPRWAGDKSIKPLLLFAQEDRARAVGLDGRRAADGTITVSGASLTVDFQPPGQPPATVNTTARVQWSPFCAPSAATPVWAVCDSETWWNELERRSPASQALPGDDPADSDLGAGRVLLMNLYVSQLATGISRVVQQNKVLTSSLYSMKSDPEYAGIVRTALGATGTGVKAIANEVIAAGFAQKLPTLKQLGALYKNLKGDVSKGVQAAAKFLLDLNASGRLNQFIGLGALGVILALGTIITILYFNFFTDNLGGKIAFKVLVIGITSVFSIIMPFLTLKSFADAYKSIGRSGAAALTLSNELSGASKAAGVIGLVISVAVTWGFFIYSIVANKVSAFSPEFNRALAETIAATIYAVLLFVLAATLIGALLIGIIAVIDAILTAICELGVDALRNVPGLGGACFTLGNAAIKGLTYSLYNYSPMIDTGRADLLATGAPNVKLTDPARGFSAGNGLSVTMAVTTTVVHKDPDPKDGLLIYPYMWLYSADNLRTSTFKYSLTGAGEETITAARNEMNSAWQGVREERKYLASPMYRGQAAQVTPPLTGLTLNAGLNRAFPLTLNFGYAIPAYECWGLLILGVCYTRDLADSSSSALQPLSFDVFPATLDGFLATTSSGDGGQRLAWGGSIAFPTISDLDGDGLLPASRGGLDPDDTKPDSDGDGLSDAYELDRRSRGAAYNLAACDSDGDGLTDAQEAQLGTNPSRADSDQDGVTDAQEVWHQRFNTVTCQPTATWEGGWDVTIGGANALTVRVSSSPLSVDADGDGISDAVEQQLANDPSPANRVDSQNRPFSPDVANAPLISVITSGSDADGIVGLGQSFTYTTTVVTRVALSPSQLAVTLPAGLGSTTLNATLGFNPATFNESQSVSQASPVTVAGNAASGPRTLTSQVVGQRPNNGGTIIASGSFPVMVDGALPTSSLTSLVNDQYVRGAVSGRPVTVIVGGTAGDSGSGISKVEVRVNNGPWRLADGRETWSFPLSIDDGLFVVETRATDGAGNVETPGPGVTVRADGFTPRINFLNVPSTPFIPARTVAGRWAVTVGGFIDDPQVGFFSGNGEIRDGSGLVLDSVQVRVRRSEDTATTNGWQPVSITAGGQWSAAYLLPVDVADPTGAYLVELRANDVVGNESQSQAALVLDAAAPQVALSAADTARAVITGTLSVRGVISDINSPVGIDSLEASFAPINQVVPLSDAVLRLRLDEAAGSVFYADSSGRANDAACDQAPTCAVAGGPGRVDQGLAFNGVVQPLRVADAASLNFDAQESFSVAGWIKTAVSDAVIVRKGRGQQSYRLGLVNGAAAFDLGNGSIQTRASGGPAVNDNQWHFVVGTVDRASGQARLYVDGVLRDSKAVTGSFASGDVLQLGGQTEVIGGPPLLLQGDLDEITIAAHALSAAEVSAMYAAADRQWFATALSQRGAMVTSATWSLPIPANLEGEYQLDLRSRDMLGNRAVTAKVWRGVIDTRAPRMVLTAQPTGAVYFDPAISGYRAGVSYVCAAQDRYLSDASFTCPGTNLPPPTRSFDDDPIVQGLFPDLTLRSGLAMTYTQWEPVGQATRTARACDVNGNCTTQNTPLTLAPGALGAPRAVIAGPAPQAIIASDGAVSVVVVAEADQPLRAVTLSLDGAVVDTTTFAQANATTRNQRTVSVTVRGEGPHTLVARATDWTGRVQTTLFPVTFTLDTQAPTVTLDDSPLTAGDTYGPGSDVLRFNGTASDGVGLAAVQISINGGPFADVTFGNGTWRTALPVTDPEGKVLSVTLRAIDLAGRVSTLTRSITVDISTPNPPGTAITSSPTNPAVTASASFSFTGTPGERGIGGYACRLDGGPFVTCSSPQAYSGLSKGAHMFQVRAIDAQGYVDLSPASFSWTVTDAPPPPPGNKVYLPMALR